MRIRLTVVGVCILTFPLWFSSSPGDKLTNSVPFVTVAYAGHTLTGEWCDCGTPGCIPDRGEICGNNNARAADNQEQSAPTDSGSDVDPGAGVLMLALVFFLWMRLRT